jgi:hypothetical protein
MEEHAPQASAGGELMIATIKQLGVNVERACTLVRLRSGLNFRGSHDTPQQQLVRHRCALRS